MLNFLKQSKEKKAVLIDPASKQAKVSQRRAVKKAKLALVIYSKYQGEGCTKASVAAELRNSGLLELHKNSKREDQEVSQYLSHAKALLESISKGSFYDAMLLPLSKKV